jgi:tRNA pseudouridine13 synthase
MTIFITMDAISSSMYKIKEAPEDFIVKEINKINLTKDGNYLICILKKTNYTTTRALEQIARNLKIPLKNIGYAGIKDKNAITEQYISIKNIAKDKIIKLNLKDIKLNVLGYSDEPIVLGKLIGNEFIITIRCLKDHSCQIILESKDFQDTMQI